MKQQRGQRQGVENLWVSRSGQRTKLFGKGMQYRARYVDTSGQEHTQRFKYKADAKDWLKQITRGGVDIAPPVTGNGLWRSSSHSGSERQTSRQVG
jgi:hypothetical protein